MDNISVNTNNIEKPQKSTLAGDIKSTLAFTGIMQAGFGAKYLAQNRSNSIKNLELETFKKYNAKIKPQATKDVFQKAKNSISNGLQTSANYEELKKIKGTIKKAQKNLKHAEGKGIKGKFREILGLNKNADINGLKKAVTAAEKNADDAVKSIANGKNLSKAADIASKNLRKNTKDLFISELKNPFILGFTLLGAIPRVIGEAVPTFKEKGFKEGMKVTGKIAARTAVDLFSNAGFSVAGRAIGTAIGSIFPGIGNVVGGTIGDAVGSAISMHITEKIFDDDEKEKQEQTEQEELNTAQNNENMVIQEEDENAETRRAIEKNYGIYDEEPQKTQQQGRKLDIKEQDYPDRAAAYNGKYSDDPYLDKKIIKALSI